MNREDNQYQEKLLKISRVSKTTKGGRTISFSVLAAVGDGEGKIGLGLGKANGVPDAIRKAVAAAKKNIVKVSLKNNTIPHEITGKWGATTLWMAPAYEGTGVIAGCLKFHRNLVFLLRLPPIYGFCKAVLSAHFGLAILNCLFQNH